MTEVINPTENLLVQTDASILQLMPYDNMIKLIGQGYGLLDSNKEVYFLVTKWIPGGDLSTRIEGTSFCSSYVV